jgi:phospholipase/carboxylesterase
MLNDLTGLEIGAWTLRLRRPPGDGPHPVIFLIHGWTGDENSMWVFAPRLPKGALLIAPRAPFVSTHPQLAGYSWVPERGQDFSRLPDFEPAVAAFADLLKQLAVRYPANFSSFGMIGFSQGAAFSVAYTLAHRDHVNTLAMLAGFLPADSDAKLTNLKDLAIFIAHGTKDETVPVARAREARERLETAGARVSYCESEIGHKLGASCFKELADFFATRLP